MSDTAPRLPVSKIPQFSVVIKKGRNKVIKNMFEPLESDFDEKRCLTAIRRQYKLNRAVIVIVHTPIIAGCACSCKKRCVTKLRNGSFV